MLASRERKRPEKEGSMGRMLEALNRTQARPAPAAVPLRPVAEEMPVVEAVECPVERADPQDEVIAPFIEVGGPRSAIDGSPDVLAAPPPRLAPMQLHSKPATDPTAADECVPAGMVSIWCSWTLRPGMKVAK